MQMIRNGGNSGANNGRMPSFVASESEGRPINQGGLLPAANALSVLPADRADSPRIPGSRGTSLIAINKVPYRIECMSGIEIAG